MAENDILKANSLINGWHDMVANKNDSFMANNYSTSDWFVAKESLITIVRDSVAGWCKW